MQVVEAKSILNRKRTRDSWFLDDYTLNAYSGCTFNCQFCYIRGSKYGEYMTKKTSAKTNGPELLEKQLALRSKKRQYGFIVIGSATDPYLHFEDELKLTRQLLEVVLKFRFPVHIITRSPLVERDFDLLSLIQDRAFLPVDLMNHVKTKAIVSFSFSSINPDIEKHFEPNAPSFQKRLHAMNAANSQGIMTGATAMPLLPYLSDSYSSMVQLIETVKESGGQYAVLAPLTLFGNGKADSKTLTFKVIAKHYPESLKRYEELFSQSHSVSAGYLKAFYERAKRACEKVKMPTSILEADKTPIPR